MTLVDTEVKGPVGLITLNNPPMNVLCTALLEDLGEAAEQMEADANVRVVVITGAGRAFVAGADIKEMVDMGPAEAMAFARKGQGVFDRLQSMTKPVIGAINGFALGGGTELALACDVRIASEAAKFGQPEVNLGVMPGFGGTQRLSRLVGPGKAKELIFTGDIISAQQALSISLAQAVVDGYKKDDNGELVKNEKGKPVPDSGPVVAAAMEMATKMAGKGPVALKLAKKVINEGLDWTLKEGLDRESQQFGELFTTQDQKEGMAAFMEKRPANFTGK